MAIVNYVREHRRFIRYASDKKLTASERLLWYALMEIINQEADGNDWPDDFISISNNRVLTYCGPMGFDTMARARNGLKQRGLIDFKPGNKNKENPSYKMRYFSPNYPGKAEFYPQNADNMRDNIGDNMRDNIGGNIQDNDRGNMGNIYININKDLNQNENDDSSEEEEEDSLRARAREAAAAAWKRCYGRPPATIVAEGLGNRAAMLKFDPGVLEYAIELAAYGCVDRPTEYIGALMKDWSDAHVRTTEEAQQYAFLHSTTYGYMKNSAYGKSSPDELHQFMDDLAKR